MEAVYIFLLAIFIDLVFGEPPNAIHPVVWMGKVISFLLRDGQKLSPRLQFVLGMITVFLTLAVFVTPVYFLLSWLKDFNLAVYIVVSACLLKTTFSLKGLGQAALKIKKLLVDNKLSEARFELRALVGRNTRDLNTSQMVSATIESVGENSCDSIFAPFLYFALLGVPGAVGYRVINTLDSMIGHHGEFEYLGKFAARLDTIVNFIPARIAALAIVVGSWIFRRETRKAWQIMRRDSGKTESPNAGWTMSAMSGALDVQLEKIGYYKLGDSHRALHVGQIDLSLKIVLAGFFIWASVILITEVVYYALA